MNKQYKAGLILAKFAPLHAGHQYVIDTALRITPDLTIIVYDCPDRTHIPLNIRCGWVRKLYPQINVIEGWDAPNEHEDTPEIRRKQEAYVGKVLRGKKITHFFSSEFYGEHMSKYLGAINYLIDTDRDKIPISSTMIRNDPYRYREFLNPVVLEDILTKVVILSLPSKKVEKVVKKVAEKLSTVYVNDNLIDFLKNKNFDSITQNIDFYSLAKKRVKERSTDNLLYKSKQTIIFNSASLIDHLLNIAINRKYDSNYAHLRQ